MRPLAQLLRLVRESLRSTCERCHGEGCATCTNGEVLPPADDPRVCNVVAVALLAQATRAHERCDLVELVAVLEDGRRFLQTFCRDERAKQSLAKLGPIYDDVTGACELAERPQA